MRLFRLLGLPPLKLAPSSLTRQSCHPHPYPNKPMQLRLDIFKDFLCGVSSNVIIRDAGVLNNLDERKKGQRVGVHAGESQRTKNRFQA